MFVYYSGLGQWIKAIPVEGSNKPETSCLSDIEHCSGIFTLVETEQKDIKYTGKTETSILCPCKNHPDGIDYYPDEPYAYFSLTTGEHDKTTGYLETRWVTYSEADVIKTHIAPEITNLKYTLPLSGKLSKKDILCAVIDIPNTDEGDIDDLLKYIEIVYCNNPDIYKQCKKYVELMNHPVKGVETYIGKSEFTKDEACKWIISVNGECPDSLISEQPMPENLSKHDIQKTPESHTTHKTEELVETKLERLVKERENIINAKQLAYDVSQEKKKQKFTSNLRLLIAAAWIYTGMYKDQRDGGGYDAIRNNIKTVNDRYGLELLKGSDSMGFKIAQKEKTIMLLKNDDKKIEDALADIKKSHQDYIDKIIKISKYPDLTMKDVKQSTK